MLWNRHATEPAGPLPVRAMSVWEAKARTEHSDSVTFQQADFCPWSHLCEAISASREPFYLPGVLSPPTSDRPQTDMHTLHAVVQTIHVPIFDQISKVNANVFVASQVI